MANIQSLETRNAQLDDELRDALRQVAALRGQAKLAQDDFEGQLSRLKENYAQQMSRLETDLNDAREARNRYRGLASAHAEEAEQAMKLAGVRGVELETLRAEVGRLREEKPASTTALNCRTPSRCLPASPMVSDNQAGNSPRVPAKCSSSLSKPFIVPRDLIELSSDDDDDAPIGVESSPTVKMKLDSSPPNKPLKDHNIEEKYKPKLDSSASPNVKVMLHAKPEGPTTPIKRSATEMLDSPKHDPGAASLLLKMKRRKMESDERASDASPPKTPGSKVDSPVCKLTFDPPAPSIDKSNIENPSTSDIQNVGPPRAVVYDIAKTGDQCPSASKNAAHSISPAAPAPLEPEFKDGPPSELSDIEDSEDGDAPSPSRKRKNKKIAKKQFIRPFDTDSDVETPHADPSSAHQTRQRQNSVTSASNTAVLPSLNARVASFGSFSGDLPSSLVDVSRAFLTAVYGIPGMPMLVKIAPGKNAPAGSPRHMILPRSDNNPGLPVRAGAPGTMLCNRSDVLENGPLALWVKIRAKEKLWRYMGDYELRRAEQPLSVSEAQQFSCSTITAWGNTLKNRKWDVYAEIRVRIWLRKHGEEVTEKILQRQMEIFKAKDAKKIPIDLSNQDIHDALCVGEETLHVVTLRCVGYDYEFLADLKTKWATFVPKEKGN